MLSEETVDVTCSDCGMDLVLSYRFAPKRSDDAHPLGCPECQSTKDIPAIVEELQQQATPKFLVVTALEKDTEIGLGADTEPQSGVAAEADVEPHLRPRKEFD